MTGNAIFLTVFFIHISGCLQAQKELPIVSDRNEPSFIPFYNPPKEYNGYSSKSFYFLARDSTQIAVDLYLPKGMKPGTKIPAILSQTRYWRSVELTWIAKWFAEKKTNKPGNRIGYLGEIFPFHGYAWLDVDVRGTGASGGARVWDLSPIEISDGNEIVEWIIRQPWSNGRVGATGLSYSSETSERLLISQNFAVKAVAARFNPFDFYEDLGFPGGVPNFGFFKEWGQIEKDLDNNIVPAVVPKKDAKYLRGVKIPQSISNEIFRQITSKHRHNYDFAATMAKVVNRDDFPLKLDSANSHFTNQLLADGFKNLETVLGRDFQRYGIDIASTHTYRQSINASGTPIYLYSGWFDGGFANAAIKKFLNYTNPYNHLILGPWDHGGFFNISPYDNTGSVFDHRGELLKFFDAFLKPTANSPYSKQARVLYYTMVEDKWKQAQNWPVQSSPLIYHFNTSYILDTALPKHTAPMIYDTYIADTTATTGTVTRWSSLTKGPLHNPYKNRNQEDKKLLAYTTRPLVDSLIITGHPMIELYLSANCSDGAVFVYLEDVDEFGNIHYITEGCLRLIHRKISDVKEASYQSLQPYRSFKAKDAAPMTADKIEKLIIMLQPTSYLIKKGHRVRVAIAGADRNNFLLIPDNTRAEYKIYRDAIHSSRIILPKTPF